MTVELHYNLHSKLLLVICTVKYTLVWLDSSLSVHRLTNQLVDCLAAQMTA